MRIIDRFDKYMKIKGLNDNRVTTQLGFSVGLLGNTRKRRDLSQKSIETILSFYKDIEKVWLLTGEGNMLKPENKENYADSEKYFINKFDIEKYFSIIEKLNHHIKELTTLNKKLTDQNIKLTDTICSILNRRRNE